MDGLVWCSRLVVVGWMKSRWLVDDSSVFV